MRILARKMKINKLEPNQQTNKQILVFAKVRQLFLTDRFYLVTYQLKLNLNGKSKIGTLVES